MKPCYLELSEDEAAERADKAWKLLTPCRVCPRACGVDRAHDEKKGFCRTGAKPRVSAAHPHFGEESCLVGSHGSGTIFFSSCNLACQYCQNWEISQLALGQEVELDDLVNLMMALQRQGCHNINLVSPTIWAPQIIKAVMIARDQGLKLPLVYNTGGYDAVATLKLLDGIIDIYMPDIKYSDSKLALKYSWVPNYWQIVKRAVKEMHCQVGDLQLDEEGLATRGLLIRHLILPQGIAGTRQVMNFIASLSKDSYVNIMDQYYPANKADRFPEINRRIYLQELQEAIEFAKQAGLHRF